MDKYRIDSHKLIFHVDRVQEWLEGKNICPLYVEISPSGSCNHRCVYCALDFMGYQPRFLNKGILKKRLVELAKLGVKSIMYAGEGEPLLHPQIGQIIGDTKKAGMDVAVTTNGVFFDHKVCDATLPLLSWLKVSITAGTKTTYARIHQTRQEDFDRVFKNMAYAAKIKRRKGLKCALGMQAILLPENYMEIALLVKKAKQIGMDYLVVKPYSQHPQSKTQKYKNIKYKDYQDLEKRLHKFSNGKFNVIFRVHAMEKWDEGQHPYKHCLALPFWSYIDSAGDFWACANYLTKGAFRLGNIYASTIKQILNSEIRERLIRWAGKEMDSAQCRVNCRMDEINRYLWDLTHPTEHVNFI